MKRKRKSRRMPVRQGAALARNMIMTTAAVGLTMGLLKKM